MAVIEKGQHKPDCKKPGFRYAATVRRTKATIAADTAGRVVLICKTTGCPAKRLA